MCISTFTLLFLLNPSPVSFSDPSQHATLKSEIESQSTALYSTARLWDDGILRPVDTRDTLGLALGLSYGNLPGKAGATGRGAWNGTWDGGDKGFGVYRM